MDNITAVRGNIQTSVGWSQVGSPDTSISWKNFYHGRFVIERDYGTYFGLIKPLCAIALFTSYSVYIWSDRLSHRVVYERPTATGPVTQMPWGKCNRIGAYQGVDKKMLKLWTLERNGADV